MCVLMVVLMVSFICVVMEDVKMWVVCLVRKKYDLSILHITHLFILLSIFFLGNVENIDMILFHNLRGQIKIITLLHRIIYINGTNMGNDE